MPRGRPANEQRRQLAFRLRAAGLSLRQIGARLGVSRQPVQKILSPPGNARLATIRCRECGQEIARFPTVSDSNRSVWCLARLSQHP